MYIYIYIYIYIYVCDVHYCIVVKEYDKTLIIIDTHY